MSEFNNDLHSDLFKLMILASNDRWLFNNPFVDDYSIDQIMDLYLFQFNDRSYHQEEFTGWVSSYGKRSIETTSLVSFEVQMSDNHFHFNSKIKFKFED